MTNFRIKNGLRKAGKVALFAVPLLAAGALCLAQTPSLSDVESGLKGATSSVKVIINWIVGVVLAIGVIYVIYAWLSESPKKREITIGVGVAILLAGVLLGLVFKTLQ